MGKQRDVVRSVTLSAAMAPRIHAGFASRTGRRRENQDYLGAHIGEYALQQGPMQLLAIADGVSAGNGGRAAAEITVRGFIDGMSSLDPTQGVAHAASRVLDALNGWLHAVARQDAALHGAATTFTGLVLVDNDVHVLHVGDTRAYHLHEGQLVRLTQDHTVSLPDRRQVLQRAVGLEGDVRLEHRCQALHANDRLMLCSDGVHSVLSDAQLRELLQRGRAPGEQAGAIVEAALLAGSPDNASCIVIDVIEVPRASESALPDRPHAGRSYPRQPGPLQLRYRRNPLRFWQCIAALLALVLLAVLLLGHLNRGEH